jgi:hypothetical protein
VGYLGANLRGILVAKNQPKDHPFVLSPGILIEKERKKERQEEILA